MTTRPLLKRYIDEDGNEMMAVAAWFYDEMAQILDQFEALQALNLRLAAAVVDLNDDLQRVRPYDFKTNAQVQHALAIATAKQIMEGK